MDTLRDFFNQTMVGGDPYSSQYPLMGTPHKYLALVSLYLTVCMQGPKWMEGAKPFNIRFLIIAHNLGMVVLSSYIFINTATNLYEEGYSISCEPLEKYRTPTWLHLGWVFTMSKLVEFIDTLLFILVKKNSHVTFLHVYHHSVMAMFTWLGFKHMPGGPNVVYVLLNSFVHVIMYVYYALAAMGPQVRKYLWWKRYLTILQLGQFFIYLTQGVINLSTGCPIPRVFMYGATAFTVTVTALFLHFYVTAYRAKPKPQSPQVNGHTALNGHKQMNGHQQRNGLKKSQ